MAESSSRGPPPRKKPRSDVWEYFEAVRGEKKVKCLLCTPHKEIAFHGSIINNEGRTFAAYVNEPSKVKIQPSFMPWPRFYLAAVEIKSGRRPGDEAIDTYDIHVLHMSYIHTQWLDGT